MKIFILNSEYPPIGGGAGNASANLAAELARLGNEVAVLTVRFGDQAERERVPVGGGRGFDLYRIPALRRRADRSGALGQGAFMFCAALGGLPLVRRIKPDVVFAFFGVPSGAAALFWKFLGGAPYVVSLRGGDVPGFRPYDFALFHRLISPLLRVVWLHAGAVVANSGGLRDLGAKFMPHIPIRIIPNGVDLDGIRPERETEMPDVRLLFCGRVVYQKGLDVLLPALAGLQDLPWRLTIAGDGPQRPALEDQAAQLGIRERIHFRGWLEKAAALEQYRQADLFVFPSRHEGMPNAVLEAMASGLPVVATAIAGSEELLLDGETGRLVPVEDTSALGEALRALIGDAVLRRRMGVAGRRRVEEHYSWRSTAVQYENLFREITGTR